MDSEKDYDRPNNHPTFTRFGSQALLPGAKQRAADLVALIYIGFIATVATVTGIYYMLFPELSALSWDVMELPNGRWAGAPLMLAFTPALTGLVGTIITRTLSYGFVSVLLTVIVCVGVLRGMRSPIAPAISAGLLPLVIGVTSWWYPPGILFGTSVLAAISTPWKRYMAASAVIRPNYAAASGAESGREGLESAAGGPESRDCGMGSAPSQQSENRPINPRVAHSCASDGSDSAGVLPAISARHLLSSLLVFVGIAMVAVKLTGMRFILFPPLVVILYEMLSHREHCPWVGRPIALPTACFASAAGGYFLFAHIASAPFVAMFSMAWGIVVLRTLDLHMPPVLAVALLPLVMNHPTFAYPVSVGFGTMLASAWFELLCKWQWIEPRISVDAFGGKTLS